MIAWVLWFFMALPLFLLDGWFSGFETLPMPDLTLALCLFMAMHARPASLPGLLIFAGLARTVVLDGDAALHILALGIPVAVLVPARVMFFRRHALWQCLAAGFLTLALAKVGALLGRFADGEIAASVSFVDVMWAMLLVPPAAWILRSLPPLSRFRERSE